MNIETPLNHLLAALPAEVKKRLAPHLEFVALPGGEILLVGDSGHNIHFPADAIIGPGWFGGGSARARVTR